MSLGDKIEDFADDFLVRGKAFVAANLLCGWQISFHTGWGSSIKNPAGETVSDGMRCPQSVLDLADFADAVMTFGGGDNTWVTGAKSVKSRNRSGQQVARDTAVTIGTDEDDNG